MKKFLFLSVFFIAGFQLVKAQETKFGLTAGYLNAESSYSFEGSKSSETASGFFVGALADFTINESFHITPGVNYGKAEEVSFLYIPVMAQYYIAESSFFLQAGPQVSILLDNNGNDSANKFGLDLGLGVGYHITENFFIDAKYSFELTNRLGELNRDGEDNRLNGLFLGVGYKF
ncbi:porin family protein [Gramella sp. BOM4]|nr:porin family protein [Christiangramia bathymodioli]